MRTTEEALDDIDKAEADIIQVLKKYDLTIGMLYDDGVALKLTATDEYPSGDWSVTERECDF